MTQILMQLLPALVFFGIGVLIRKLAVAEESHGHFLLRVVLNVSLPLLIISTLSNASISRNMAILPIASIAISMACMLITLLVIKVVKVERVKAGSMLLNTMILNGLFMLPFIGMVYGEEGLVDAILFIFGNVLLLGTYVHIMACKYGGIDHSRWSYLINILKTPMSWAIALALVMSARGISLTPQLEQIINPLAQLTLPLIMIAMGIIFSLSTHFPKEAILTILIRMMMGMAFGLVIASYLGLQGTTFFIVIICAAAPVGVKAISFSAIAKLDTELTERAVSISMLLGLVFIPFLLVFFGPNSQI